MNKLQAVSIFDNKAETYTPPCFVPAVGVATRDFASLVNDGKSMQSQFPSDFALYHLGEFDPHTGCFVTLAEPKRIVSGSDVKAK